jgi:hypothetical protein
MIDDESYPWLGWVAMFAVKAARGAAGLPPPQPPDASADPVVGMALLVIEAELTVGGRVPEALERFDIAARPGLGPFGDLAGVLNGLALVLEGRGAEALPWVERAAAAARALDAPPAATVAAALRAEVTGATTDLPPAPDAASSISEALLLRAHAVRGDRSALEALRRDAPALAMSGLLLGLEAGSGSGGRESSADG